MSSIPSTQQPFPPSRPRQKQDSSLTAWLIRLPVLFITGFVLVLIILATFLTAFQLRYVDLIVPGVSSMGVPLGGLTYDEAVERLENEFAYANEAIFTFRDRDDFFQLTAGEIGVSLNVKEMVDEAFLTGHRGNIVNDLWEQAQAWFIGKSIAPIIEYNQAVAIQRLTEIAAQLERQPQNASLQLNGTTVNSTNGQTGRSVDITSTITQLDQAILNLHQGAEIQLMVNETPPLIWNVDHVATKLQLALASPVTLTATDEDGQQLGPWTASVDQIASLLSVQLENQPDGTQQYDVHVNVNLLENFLISLAPGLIVPATDGRFHFNEQTRQLEVISPSSSGRELNVADTLQRLEEAIFSANARLVPMSFSYTLPKYHNQISGAELGIIELVAEATSYFDGSTVNRRTNIAVGASKIDGIIIAPGEEFSFNQTIGDIASENGFVEGKIIFGGRTTAGLGGGICQVSTTIFRAAFEAGYPIIERNSHGYRVGYYELNGFDPGLDAAIWQPQEDFRFQNDTEHHILIQTSIIPNQNAIQFRFYSTDIGRRVEIEEAIIKNLEPAPPTGYIANPDVRLGEAVQVDYAAQGADVTVYRNIYDAQGNLLLRDHIYTHYLPWQALFEVAPGDPRLNQA